MKRVQTSVFLMVAFMSAFWAYTVIDTLLTKFSANITLIDLGTIFILGLITGIFLGFAIIYSQKKPSLDRDSPKNTGIHVY